MVSVNDPGAGDGQAPGGFGAGEPEGRGHRRAAPDRRPDQDESLAGGGMSPATAEAAIPPEREEGWERLEGDIPFMLHNGPVWYRRQGGGYECGFLPRAGIHANRRGFVHGGMLAAFADFGLGHACGFATGGRVVTVQLGMSYVAAARPGRWIGCSVEIARRTRSLCFPRGDLVAGGVLLATASGVWKILA